MVRLLAVQTETIVAMKSLLFNVIDALDEMAGPEWLGEEARETAMDIAAANVRFWDPP